jgi:outer membrane protein assembly factor BamB
VVNGLVYLGTQYNASGPTGWLLALNAMTGEKVWMVQPDTSNAFPVITASPTVVLGMVFVGMTSNEEFAAASNSYPCCSARGSVVALDAFTGRKQTQVGPGSSLGGMEWGSASDGTRIYVAISNYYGIPYAAGSAGFWAALDPATGKILWQVPDPNGSVDLGPVTAVNGVVYAPSMSGTPGNPTMLALDASSGATLWSYAAGSSVIAGATVAEGSVFWGSGYTHLGSFLPFTGNTKLYSFTVNGK